MADDNRVPIMTKLFGALGKWIIGGLLSGLLGLGLYIWSDLSADNKSLSLQLHKLDTNVGRIATIQERVLTDVEKNTAMIIKHLIDDKDMTEGE